MQYSNKINPILAMIAIMMAFSCSNDPNGLDQVEIREDGKVHVNVGAEMENTIEVTTRATEGYEDFKGQQYNGWVMGVLANSDGVTDKGTATYSWSGSTGTWSSDLWLGPSDYDFYAYIPYDKDASVELEDASSQPKLVFNDRAPFVTKDLLVSVGANNKDQTVTTGSYKASVSQTGTNNQVDFRMNHILAKLILKFQLPEGQYDDLRKIEITSVTLGSDIANSRTYDITCNYTGEMACTFTPSAANANEKASLTLAYNGEGTSILGGKALTLSASTPGPLAFEYEEGSKGVVYVIPDVVNNNDKCLKLTITYNIFTKDSTTGDYVETRHQVTATNSSLVVCKKSGVATAIEAAKVYTLTVKVVPTYLYVLADIDQSSSIVLK